MTDTARKRYEAWTDNTPEAFLTWVHDIKPRILINNRYEVFQPTDHQLYLINQILKPADAPTNKDVQPVKPLGERSHNARKARPGRPKKTQVLKPVERKSSFACSLSLLIEPRRHGKSSLLALICLWLFTSRRNITIQCLGNTESHTRRVQFNTLKKIISNTPSLRKLIPEKNIYVFEIQFPALGNIIQMSPGNNPSTAYGDKLDVLWVSDLHACNDLTPFNALQAALLDSQDSLLLIDSNVDHTDGTVHLMQKEAEHDPTIFCHHTWYKDFEDYEKHAPPWISRPKAKRLQKTTLDVDFRRDILGKRSDAQNALFPSDVIELCKTPYKTPVDDITELTQGRAYKVGGGLDRSKSLLGSALGADNTVWTCILKVANPESEEPEIYILNQQKIVPNTSRAIKKAILKDHERYKLDNIILEDYEIMDLLPWLEAQDIPVEKMTAHSTRQNASFPELARIAREGRLHFPEDETGLISEMATFAYTQRKWEGYHFGHSSNKFKDDRVFSLNWAIFALRSQIMNLYSLKSIMCTSKRPNRHLCFLMGGNQLLHCSAYCEAAQEVMDLYKQFCRYQLETDLTPAEFYRAHVKLTGTKVYQAI